MLGKEALSQLPLSGTISRPLTTYISSSNCPQVADYARVAGYALIIASAAGAPSPSRASPFVQQNNVQAISAYEADTRQQIFRPLVSGKTPRIGAFVYGVPQTDTTQIPAQIWPSRVAGQTPPIIPRIQAAPQLADLTQQSVFSEPLTNRQGPTVRSFTGGPLQIDLTLASQFWEPTPAKQGPVPPLVQGAPQLYDFTLQSIFSEPLLGPQGPTVRSFVGGPLQVDLTQASQFWRPTPARQGPVPPLTQGAPQQVDLTQQSVFTASAFNLQGPTIGSFVAAPQQIDLTLQSSFWKPTPAPITISTALGSYLSVGQQAFTDSPCVIWPSRVAGQVPPIIPVIAAAPQLYDFTQASVFTRPIPSNQGPTVRSFTGGPLQIDLTLASQFWEPTPARQGPVPPLTRGAPQQIDLTQASLFFRPSPANQGPVPPLTQGAPQWIDLTQVSLFIRPTPSVQGRVPSIFVQGAPQVIDLTQASVFTRSQPASIAILGPTVFPIPPVPPQFDITVNGTQVWTPSTFSPSAPAPVGLYRVFGPRVTASTVQFSTTYRVEGSHVTRDNPNSKDLT